MANSCRISILRGLIATASVVAFAGGAAALTGLVTGEHVVSQLGKQFGTGEIRLRRGETLTIANTDERLLHHAFIESDRFNFDAGDQAPGSRAKLTLSEPGDFVVRCGIHPKMMLVVHVD